MATTATRWTRPQGSSAESTVYSVLQWPVSLVFAITIVTAGARGIVIERVAYRDLLTAPVISLIIATLAVGLILRNVVRIVLGPNVYPFPPLLVNRPLRFAGVVTTPQHLLILGVCLSYNGAIACAALGAARVTGAGRAAAPRGAARPGRAAS